MNIAIVGSGNVGTALHDKWKGAGHTVIFAHRGSVADIVANAEVVVLATPSKAAIDVARSLGDTTGKVIIDAMNIVGGNGPDGYNNTADAVLANTQTTDVVKCFNTTGANNMANPTYGDQAIDMFVCGDSERGKLIATQLSEDAGFGATYDVGGNEHFHLLEQFAWFWINLAMRQGLGRDIGFKLLKR